MKTFLNLTNGLEYRGPFDGFVRIQSTQCEQRAWDKILSGLDYTFLMHAATGQPIRVVDYSIKDRCPRALWQGLPLIEMALNWWWFGHPTVESNVTGRGGETMLTYMRTQLAQLKCPKNIKYVSKFVTVQPNGRSSVQLQPYWEQTLHDSDTEFYRLCFVDRLYHD